MLNLPGSPVFVWENVTAGTVIFTCSALDPDLPSLPRAHLTYKIMGKWLTDKLAKLLTACK